MLKRGQLNHLFIYIFSIIVIALIVLFGYYIISEFTSMTNEAKLVDFRAEIVNNLKTIKHGNFINLEYHLPLNIKEACFVDLEGIFGTKTISQGLITKSPLIASKVEDAKKENFRRDNMFLLGDKGKIEFSTYIGKIKLGGPNYYCKPIEKGVLEINAEGKGDGVSFASYTLVEEIKANELKTLSFDNIMKGLKLEVPLQEITGQIRLIFDIQTNKGTGISDLFNIKVEQFNNQKWEEQKPYTWNKPILLSIPTGCNDNINNCCSNKVFTTSDEKKTPDCTNPKIAIYSLTKT